MKKYNINVKEKLTYNHQLTIESDLPEAKIHEILNGIEAEEESLISVTEKLLDSKIYVTDSTISPSATHGEIEIDDMQWVTPDA